MTFQRIVVALLVLIAAGLGAVGYVEWKMAAQVRTLKAFVEGYVFNEVVMACEQAKSLDAVQMERRQEHLGDRPELGQAGQIQRQRQLHAGGGSRFL
ncbi:hypothetical protein ACVOMS_07900 [Bradyrhizobium guangxiense]